MRNLVAALSAGLILAALLAVQSPAPARAQETPAFFTRTVEPGGTTEAAFHPQSMSRAALQVVGRGEDGVRYELLTPDTAMPESGYGGFAVSLEGLSPVLMKVTNENPFPVTLRVAVEYRIR